MCEQIYLIENTKTIKEIISDTLGYARSQYGYYKMHETGYYELKKPSSKKDLYDVLKYSLNKDKSISVKIDRKLFFKVNEKQNIVLIKFEVYKVLFPLESVERVKQPVGFVKMNFKKEDFKDVFEKVLDFTIKNYFPSHRFGCCSKYEECSDAKCCLHEDKFYAKGCYYRENLEQGKIFYGKNANI